MRWIVPATFILIAIAGCTTVLFVSVLKPTSTRVFVFSAVWLILPYVIMSVVLTLLYRKGAGSLHQYVVAVMVSIGGILFLADVIFWHSDAQGGLAVLMTPIYQGGAFALLLPVTFWMSKFSRA